MQHSMAIPHRGCTSLLRQIICPILPYLSNPSQIISPIPSYLPQHPQPISPILSYQSKHSHITNMGFMCKNSIDLQFNQKENLSNSFSGMYHTSAVRLKTDLFLDRSNKCYLMGRESFRLYRELYISSSWLTKCLQEQHLSGLY